MKRLSAHLLWKAAHRALTGRRPDQAAPARRPIHLEQFPLERRETTGSTAVGLSRVISGGAHLEPIQRMALVVGDLALLGAAEPSPVPPLTGQSVAPAVPTRPPAGRVSGAAAVEPAGQAWATGGMAERAEAVPEKVVGWGGEEFDLGLSLAYVDLASPSSTGGGGGGGSAGGGGSVPPAGGGPANERAGSGGGSVEISGPAPSPTGGSGRSEAPTAPPAGGRGGPAAPPVPSPRPTAALGGGGPAATHGGGAGRGTAGQETTPTSAGGERGSLIRPGRLSGEELEAGPEVGIRAEDQFAGEKAGVSTGVFRVTRWGDISSDLTVFYKWSGTATYGPEPDGDYEPESVPGFVTIPAGESSARVLIVPIQSDPTEPPETVILTLEAPADLSYTVRPADPLGVARDGPKAVVTIFDDAAATAVWSLPSDSTASERTSTQAPDVATIDLYRDDPTGLLTVAYTLGGTAANGTDYATLSGSVTFADGQTSTALVVSPINDGTYEGSETVTYTLSTDASYWLRDPGAQAITIFDNDTPGSPASSVAGRTWDDRDGDGVRASDEPALSGLAVQVIDAHGTTVGTDTTDGSGEYSVAGLAQGLYQVALGLSAGTAFVSPDAGADTADSDVLPATGRTDYFWLSAGEARTGVDAGLVKLVTADGVWVTPSDPEAREPADTGAVTVHRRNTSGSLTVNYSVAGTAVNGTDYTTLSGSVSFATGEASKDVLVTPTNDATHEGTETVRFTLGAGTGYAAAGPSAATVNLRDNDGAGTNDGRRVWVTVPDASGAEPGTSDTALFRFHRSDAGAAVTVTYSVGGTATAGSDYTTLSGSVVIPADERYADVEVEPLDDTTAESLEVVTATVTAAPGYDLDPGAGAAVIVVDNDGGSGGGVTPTADYEVTAHPQGNAAEGGTVGGFVVARVGSAGDLTVNFLLGGTAANGTDYTSLAGSVVIPDGSPYAVVRVTPSQDTLVEGTETVSMTLQSGTGYTIGSPGGTTVDLTDDDSGAGLPTASLAWGADAAEPSTDGSFVASRTGPTTAALTVTYSISGTAGNGSDYQTLTGTVVIPAGAASTTVPLDLIDDAVYEGSELATFTLSAGTWYNMASGSGRTATVPVADDEVNPLTTVTVGWGADAMEPSTDGSFVVTRESADVSAALTVTYTVGGTATNGTDYTTLSGSVVIPGGDASVTLTVDVIDDLTIEGTELVTITLQPGAGYALDLFYQDELDIGDNDIDGGGGGGGGFAGGGDSLLEEELPTVSVGAVDPMGSEFSTSTAQFNFRRSGDLSSSVLVSYTLAGNAVEGRDYTADPAGGVIGFGPYETLKGVLISPLADGLTEGDEYVEVQLTPGSGYELGVDSAVATIVDDAPYGRPRSETPGTVRVSADVLNSGDVSVTHQLLIDIPNSTCGCQPTYLVYHSETVVAQPVVQVRATTDPDQPIPDRIEVKLFWDGAAAAVDSAVKDTSALSPGDSIFLALRPAAGQATGRHTYRVVVTARYGDDPGSPGAGLDRTTEVTGQTFVVNRANSAFGPGVAFGPLADLFHVSAAGGLPEGELFAGANGGHTFFEKQGDGSYVARNSAGEAFDGAGSLTADLISGFEFTDTGGKSRSFDSSGRQTDWSNPATGEVYEYEYSGGNLTEMTAPGGHTATFAYSGGKLSSTTSTVNLPDDSTIHHSSSMAYDGSGNLTQVTDPGGGTHTFTYDGSRRITGDTFGARTRAWDHNSTTSTSGSGTPALTVRSKSGSDPWTETRPRTWQGLGDAVAVDPEDDAVGAVTDANELTTRVGYDRHGRETSRTDPTGARWDVDRDDSGYATRQSDPLGRATTYDRDAAGYALRQTNPDGSFREYVYRDEDHRLEMSVDERGHGTAYEYDLDGHMTARTDTTGAITTYTYTADDQVATVTDPNGLTTTSGYDDYRRLVTETRPGNRLTTYNYDASTGEMASMTDPLGRTIVTTTFDDLGRAVGTVDATGARTTTVLDEAGVTLGRVDTAGVRTSYVYDAAGRQVAQVDGVGTALERRTTSVYDDGGRLVAMVDALTRRTTFGYDDAGRQVTVLDAELGVATTGYDAAGQVTATVDPVGREAQMTYDRMGRVVAVTDPLLNVTSTVYDAAGNAVAQVDANGNATTTAYDEVDRAVAQKNAVGAVTTTVYDDGSRVEAQIDARGYATTILYDDVTGRQEAVQDARGFLTTSEYDAADQLTRTVNARGNPTTYHYDAVGRQDQVWDATGQHRDTVFDAAGRVSAQVDELGRRTTFGYDALGRQEVVVDAALNRATTVYDAADKVLAVVDQRANRTTFAYDRAGRQVSALDPNLKLATTVYDAAGAVIATVDQLGARTTVEYDDAGRPEVVVDALLRRTTTAYDPVGNVTQMVNARGYATDTAYDKANRPVKVTFADTGVMTTAYDQADNVTGQTDPLGRWTTFAYDQVGQLTQTTDAKGGLTSAVYDANGNVVVQTDALSRRTTFSYDTLDRQTTVQDARGGLATTAYDFAGQVVSVRDPLNRETTFAYDQVGRHTSTTAPLGHVTSTKFDEAGNAIAQVDALGRITTFTYDVRNQVTSVRNALNQLVTYAYDAVGRQIEVTDARGNTTTTVYDKAGQAVEVIDAHNKTASIVYDANGNASVQVDRLGRRTTYAYDAVDRMIQIQDALTRRTTTVYDVAGQVVAQVDALERRTSFSYDELGRNTQVENALNKLSTTVYDAVGNSIARVDELSRRTTFGYDELNRLTTVQNAQEKLATTVYDAAGQVLAQVDVLSNRTSYAYDGLGRMTEMQDALTRVWTSEYDLNGNRTATEDPLGRRTTYVYDLLGRQTQTQDALLHQSAVAFDPAGNVVTQTDALGKVTTFAYDALNRATTVTDPLARTTAFTYDLVGNAVTVTDPRSAVTTYNYDGMNRRTGVIDPLARSSGVSFDAAGNLVTSTDAAGAAVTFAYDALGRQTRTERPTGGVETVAYDAVGNVTAVRDALNQATTHTYDVLNRRVTSEDARTFVTSFAYDFKGRLTAVTDAQNNVTSYAYDALDRVTTETDPLGKRATAVYDVAGQVESRIDRLGRAKEYGHDDAGRLTDVVWKTAAGATLQTQTFDYDAVGRLTGATDPDGSYTMARDAAGQVTQVDEPFGLTLTFVYDGSSNRTAFRDSLGGTTTSTYDLAGQMTRRELRSGDGTLNSEARWDTTYTDRGQPLVVTRYGDVAGSSDAGTTSYAYDAAGRLTNIQERTGAGGLFGNLTYTYDLADRVTARVDQGTTTDYLYDQTDQLIKDGAAATLTYDGTGNRTVSGYSTGSGNRLTTDGLWTYTYDDAGNMTKRSKGASAETWTYTYDHDMKLTVATQRATDGGALIARLEYAYDAFGNRLIRKQFNSLDVLVQEDHFAYDGWNTSRSAPVGTENFDLWADLTGTNALVTRRAYGDGIDQVMVRMNALTTGANWYRTDMLGSVESVTSATGVPTATLAYDAFGGVASNSAPSVTDRYLYTGREWDGLLGWQYTRARMYDPATGRFNSADPLGIEAGDNNLYRYVGNGYTGANDPSGLYTIAGMMEALKNRGADGEALVGTLESLLDNGWALATEEKDGQATKSIGRAWRMYKEGPRAGHEIDVDVTWERMMLLRRTEPQGAISAESEHDAWMVDFVGQYIHIDAHYSYKAAQYMEAALGEIMKAGSSTGINAKLDEFDSIHQDELKVGSFETAADQRQTTNDAAKLVEGQIFKMAEEVAMQLGGRYLTPVLARGVFHLLKNGFKYSFEKGRSILRPPPVKPKAVFKPALKPAAQMQPGVAANGPNNGGFSNSPYPPGPRYGQSPPNHLQGPRASGETPSPVPANATNATPRPPHNSGGSGSQSATHGTHSSGGGAAVGQTAARLLHGSGPASGLIEASKYRKLFGALKGWNKKEGVEYVFDPVTERLVLGKPNDPIKRLSPHEKIVSVMLEEQKLIGPRGQGNFVAGMIHRDSSGRIATNEFSGHFGVNWNDKIREQFCKFVKSLGEEHEHMEWK